MGQPDRRHLLHGLDGARLVASVAATVIALACGTNYVYSAWAPQFAERLRLSSTHSNLVGLFGNLGMYSLGVPVGVLVDRRGPRPFVLLGALLLVASYAALHQAYLSASASVATLCFFAFLSGLGSCMAFAAAVKTSALNWPRHRGTATAFPLAAFGLSAFFFSSLGALFPTDPGSFLKLLSCGTFSLTFAGFFFLRVCPSSSSARLLHSDADPGTSPGSSATVSRPSPDPDSALPPPPIATIDETSSLMSCSHSSSPICPPSSSSEAAAAAAADNTVAAGIDVDTSHSIDIRGPRLLHTRSFWHLFSIMAILAGVGLMTINNVGNNVNALWRHFDGSVDQDFLVHRQQIHVSILSLCSFGGRLLSGIGSDFLVTYLHVSRLWCLFVACLVFLVAQVCALSVQNPYYLGFVSGLSGLGYGFLFGVFPSLVAEAFGIRGLSQNWGFMTFAPVISSNVFNLFYGTIFDKHSVIDADGQRSCPDGLECYRAAYWVTFGACLAGLIITLRAIRHERAERVKESRS